MSYPNSNLQHYNGFAVPIYPILHTAPPILRNQNTDQESWKADRKAWKEHAEEDWFTGQSEEPYLPHNGKSILVRWLNDEGQGWTCCVPLDVEGRWCDHKPFGRIDRALAHVRKHLNLKPFPCEEHCGTEGCVQRFHSSEKRRAHQKGPDYRPCDLCGELELRQNMARHKRESCNNRPHQVEEAT